MSADFDDSQFQIDSVQKPADNCIPMFYTKPTHNKVKSDAEGRPIYEDVPYVKILIPGNSRDIMDRKVSEADKERWPKQWQAYLNKQEQQVEGTPLTLMPTLSQSRIAELEHVNIRTIEQLAGLDEAGITAIGHGGRALVEQAKNMVNQAADAAEAKALRDENAQLKERLAAIEARLDASDKSGAESSQGQRPAPSRKKKASAKQKSA